VSALRVYSIFRSLQGESTRAGLPCVFVRLAGCTVGCLFCDTRDAAVSSGRVMTIDEILQQVSAFGCPLVEVTGGEPLEQPSVHALLSTLCDTSGDVLLETSGAYPIDEVDARVRVVMDVKTPSSGVAHRFLDRNIDEIRRRRGEVKFVISDQADFDFAVERAVQWNLVESNPVLISPAAGFDAAVVARWILDSGLHLRLQLQLHRVLWPDVQGDI